MNLGFSFLMPVREYSEKRKGIWKEREQNFKESETERRFFVVVVVWRASPITLNATTLKLLAHAQNNDAVLSINSFFYSFLGKSV